MTTYGTIPTSSSAGPANMEFISRAKERIQAGLGTRRPWREMFQGRLIGLPQSASDALERVKSNISYFQMNYAIIILSVLFVSLIWHPISLIVFLIMMLAWLFFYFLRDQPLLVFNRTIGDRTVMIVLLVLTVVMLLLTHATFNILGALLVGVVLVLVHAAIRKMEYWALDEEASGFLRSAAAVRGPPPPSSS
ncbi:hypothetical protein Leryth_025720 [Lithospermum erythrorhizon]|nr:hypothetical protein Leryth_025720 [Lithospermum erythrorhizon]